MKIIIFAFMAVTFAHGAFLIEPYAGVNINGGWKDDGSNSTSQFSGNMYGARVGIERLGLLFGIDARKGSWDIDNDQGTELSYTHYAAFVGYDFPILLRVYGEYLIGGTGVDQNDNTLIQPTGFVFGVGYKFFPYLSANLEFGNVAYKELELDDGTNLQDRDEAGTYLLLSLSAPITIGL